jgi:hypothetical protein
MAKRTGNDSPIGDVLKQIIEQNRLQSGMDSIRVRDAWFSLMGNGVRSYTRNVALKGSTLYVELTSSVLREELSYGKDKIIKMINEELGRNIISDVILR